VTLEDNSRSLVLMPFNRSPMISC